MCDACRCNYFCNCKSTAACKTAIILCVLSYRCRCGAGSARCCVVSSQARTGQHLHVLAPGLRGTISTLAARGVTIHANAGRKRNHGRKNFAQIANLLRRVLRTKKCSIAFVVVVLCAVMLAAIILVRVCVMLTCTKRRLTTVTLRSTTITDSSTADRVGDGSCL